MGYLTSTLSTNSVLYIVSLQTRRGADLADLGRSPVPPFGRSPGGIWASWIFQGGEVSLMNYKTILK